MIYVWMTRGMYENVDISMSPFSSFKIEVGWYEFLVDVSVWVCQIAWALPARSVSGNLFWPTRPTSGKGVEFVDRPPATRAGGQHDLHVTGRLLRESDDGVAATTLATGYGTAPGAAVVGYVDLVAARIVASAEAAVQGNTTKALHFCHVNLEPQARALWLAS